MIVFEIRTIPLSLFLSFSLFGFRAGFPSTCTRGRARPQAHVPRISVGASRSNEIRAPARSRGVCVVYDKYEIPSADYVLLSFAWVRDPPSLRIVAVSLPEKKRFPDRGRRIGRPACSGNLSMIRVTAAILHLSNRRNSPFETN